MRPRSSRWGRRLLSTALLGAVGLCAAACSPAAQTRATTTAPLSAFEPATVAWSAAAGSTLSPGSVLRVSAAHGSVQGLELTDGHGKPLSARVASSGGYATSAPLPPGRTLTAEVTLRGEDGISRTESRSLRTAAAKRSATASISPGDDATVGVGQPVVVTFSSAVADHAALERALTVSTSKPVGDAGWYWFSDRQAQYRPQHYWPAGTTVRVRAALADLRIGATTWGARDTTSSFTIGRAQVLKISDATHQMTVTRGGRTIRTVPVSLGKHTGTYVTRSGIKTIMSIARTVHMDSSTVGITGADAYDEDVPYGMRLTWSGEFIHGAPWSEWAQGSQDVSHGCTNVSLADGKWLYENSMVGDPVETTGTGRAMEPGNGWGGAWDIGWSSWKAGSALR